MIMTRVYQKDDNGFFKVPFYISNAMQGLAYWIRYRRSLYKYYSLSEYVVVAEFCTLLQAKLNTKEFVLCEKQYRNFLLTPPSDLEKSRIDITIAEISKNSKIKKDELFSTNNKQENGFLKDVAKVVFEVKMYDSHEDLKKDFKRLKKIKKENKDKVITYFMLVSENKLPVEFVDAETGRQLADIKKYKENEYRLNVVMVKKALGGYGKKALSKGTFICLIEVV